MKTPNKRRVGFIRVVTIDDGMCAVVTDPSYRIDLARAGRSDLWLEPERAPVTEVPDVRLVETEDEYVHVRFRDPDRFDEIRTPDWAKNAAESVSPGSEVRTGRVGESDDWEVQSVLIEAGVDEEEAREQAREIVEKIES